MHSICVDTLELDQFIKFFRTFGSDERGTVAIIFALCITMLLFVTGVAVDSARAWKTQSILHEALDATALATAGAMRMESLERVTSGDDRVGYR
jgi:uncharacterized membrane protein